MGIFFQEDSRGSLAFTGEWPGRLESSRSGGLLSGFAAPRRSAPLLRVRGFLSSFSHHKLGGSELDPP
jgi:hypothetical protein